MAKTKQKDRHKNRTRESEAIRKRQERATAGSIDAEMDAALAGIDWKKRHRAERDFMYFLRTYCTSDDPTSGAFLETPPPPEMEPIIRDFEQAIGDASIPYHVRMARGIGKTAYTKGAVLWVVSTGRRHYPVVVAANDENAAAIIEDVFACMTNNPAYVRDFPEIAIPFRCLAGAYQRAKTQTYAGRNTNAHKSASRIVLPTIFDPKTGKPFPSSGTILESVGFNSGARGKSHGILRPDLIIFDDLANDENAQNEGQVEKMARKIKKAFMGLAGHRRKMAAIMTSTPIEADDLSETFAADPGWKTKTYPLLKSWPKCHDLGNRDEVKTCRDYWAEYFDIFAAEQAADRLPHIKANRFYRQHRREMDEGAVVLNPRNFDPATEISGIQHAMNILNRDGVDTFMSEYQMQPPRNVFAFALSVKLILKRVRPSVPPNTIPAGTVLTVATTDINPGYAITTTVVTFDIQRTAFVTAYHVTPIKISEKLNDTEFEARVFTALTAHGKEIAALGIPIDKWGIDAGGRQFKTVTRFAPMAETLVGLKAIAMLGRAGQNWNPNVRSRIRSERNATILCRDEQRRRWLAWNADEYKESAHRAWATETGAAGGLSIFDGGANHYKFATQVANEKLVAKTRTKDRNGKEAYAYKWKTRNPHDYGDCVAMAFALAGSEGITGSGEVEIVKKHGHVAIGGKIVGAAEGKTEKPKEDAKPSGSETAPPPPPQKRRRIAIGGRLY